MQCTGGSAETGVGVQAGVGPGDQDGNAVDVRQIPEDLGDQPGAPAVEGEHLPMGGGKGTGRCSPVPVPVVGGGLGRRGGIGPVRGIHDGQRPRCRRGRRSGGGAGTSKRAAPARGTTRALVTTAASTARSRRRAPSFRRLMALPLLTGPAVGLACKGKNYGLEPVARLTPESSPVA